MSALNPSSGAGSQVKEYSGASRTPLLALVLIASVALALRLWVLNRTNLDLVDHFLPWLEDMRTHGFWNAIARPFSKYGYTPFYSYAIGIADAILPAGTDGKTVIKSVSILFDFIAASLMYALSRLRWRNGNYALAAFAAVLFAPTIFLNGAYWGQSDIVYATFLLACVYLLLRNSAMWAMACFGMAFAIKAQAAWLGPFILMMVLRGRIRWWLLALVPAIYLALALPAVLAGRSVVELASIYLTQASTQSTLSYSAANLHFFPQYFLVHLKFGPQFVPLIARIAIVFTGIVALLFAWKASNGRMNAESILVAALVSALLVPQFLPFMHNRYFFPADILTIALAVWRPAYWPAAVIMQVNSFVTYISFLWGARMMVAPVPSWLTLFGFTNNLQPITGLEALAGIVNVLLLVWFWRRLQTLCRNPDDEEPLRFCRDALASEHDGSLSRAG